METKMCKPKNKNSIVRLFVAVVLFLFLHAPAAMAQKVMPDNKAEAAIIYLKKEDDALYFIVKVNNPDGDKFSVTIREENGENLYSRNARSKKYAQTFKAFLQGNRLNVLVVTKKTNNVVGMFEINVTNKIVEEVLVTRL